MDVHRKNVYVHRATTAIVAALDVIAPGDAGHLWEALQSSRRVEKALGIAEHQLGSIPAVLCARVPLLEGGSENRTPSNV